MLLDILHDTHYHYRAPVQVAQHIYLACVRQKLTYPCSVCQ